MVALTSDYISPEAQARHAQAVAAYALSEQKRSQSNAIRFVLNFPILIAVLYALNTVGFITVTASSTVGLTGLLTTIAVIALIFMLIRKLAGYAYGTFILFTCCTGILLAPLYTVVVGYASLWAVSYIVPGMLQLSSSLLHGIVAGLVIGIAQIPELSKPSAPEALKSEEQQARELAEKNSLSNVLGCCRRRFLCFPVVPYFL
ncbi:MAG: hypothetical protein UW60_C0030G0001 [Candidatus Woesebacteria bacterium GW2011_GWA2_44_33]|uniref:Uncharacterized protein n=1 Tax=Candidatus Woesebacteria bacterium GW2011_GWA2_44_33 TaxID=1618564 RepID=A0A0G1M204_9BACT|nr:MAG: hypothetical protein UW60_C0030G0001 [Candidatus Woesebacteria bacterium GW2011_GWA2_44_33]